ncbi:urease accessory protein UreF [Kaarinaea lacus]
MAIAMVTITAIITPMGIESLHENSGFAKLRLLQLTSPTLPIGAYSYSQGLEYAVDANWIDDETSAKQWIIGLLKNNIGYLDLPCLLRLYQAWMDHNEQAVQHWNQFVLASRESFELKKEDKDLGAHLQTLLTELEVPQSQNWAQPTAVSYLTMFSLAASHWRISYQDSLTGFTWAWCENQVAAAIKSIPLGQTAGQRILSEAITIIPHVVDNALQLQEHEIGAIAPAFAIGSALHETQYSRLFRS